MRRVRLSYALEDNCRIGAILTGMREIRPSSSNKSWSGLTTSPVVIYSSKQYSQIFIMDMGGLKKKEKNLAFISSTGMELNLNRYAAS